MKNLAIFLLGALAATLLWFSIGYLQVNDDKMNELLRHDEVVAEEVFADAEPAEEIAVQPEPEKAAPTVQPSIVGRWRIADPVGFDERDRMLQIDEFGNIKDFYSVASGLSTDYVYLIEGDIIKYGTSSNFYHYSFQFKVRSENGKDYLEIYNDTRFGGKWIRSK